MNEISGFRIVSRDFLNSIAVRDWAILGGHVRLKHEGGRSMTKKASFFIAVVFFLAGMSPGLPARTSAQAEDAHKGSILNAR